MKFFSRLSKGDLGCPLCNNDVESISHLFFKCNASKMFWFGTYWVVKADLFVVNEEIDAVKLVVDPPISITNPLLLKQNMELASVQVALTLEAISRF